MSDALYSCAISPPASRKRCVARVQPWAAASTRWKLALSVRGSAWKILLQPVSRRPLPAMPVINAWRRVMMVISVVLPRDGIAAGDHRAHLVDRSGEHHLDEVDGDEEHDREGEQEVQGTGGLAPAQSLDQPGRERVEARRHAESRHYHAGHQRQQTDISEPLQDVVAFGRLALGMPQLDVID